MSQCGWLVSVSALLPAQISLYYLTNAGSFSIFARSRNPDNNNVTGSLNEVFCDFSQHSLHLTDSDNVCTRVEQLMTASLYDTVLTWLILSCLKHLLDR